jgi:nucleotide-binding universal stress UspA family protein
MIQRILVAWDGSDVARRALDVAIDLARRYEAELVAASVAYSPPHAETEADQLESVEAARRYLIESLEKVRDRAERVGVPLQHEVLVGSDPAKDLLSFGHEHGFDLMVTGHHRTGRAGRLLLHGVPEQLVAAADIPLLVVGERNGGRRR